MDIKKWPLLRRALRSSAKGEAESELDSHMTTPALSDRLKDELADLAQVFFDDHLGPNISLPTPHSLRQAIERFFEVYANRPIRQDRKGSGFHNLFWLYLTVVTLNPKLIVESGVRKGMSTWILRMAVPQATIHSFDIDLSKLVYRDASIHSHEHDWTQLDWEGVDRTASLCFFDDHLNQARRLREAYDRGFRTLVFDDNAPAHKLYRFGRPGVPTIEMLMDQSLDHDQRIEWVWHGQMQHYDYRDEDTFEARRLIKYRAMYPDVAALTGWGPFSFLTFVKLID